MSADDLDALLQQGVAGATAQLPALVTVADS
jgi:hypothetical protein